MCLEGLITMTLTTIYEDTIYKQTNGATKNIQWASSTPNLLFHSVTHSSSFWITLLLNCKWDFDAQSETYTQPRARLSTCLGQLQQALAKQHEGERLL